MPEIIHDCFVKAPPERVYEMFTVPSALDRWWTISARRMTDAHEDWAGTKVGCRLAKHGQAETRVLF